MQKSNDRYYLAAIPEGAVLEAGLALQQELARRYPIYRRPYPPLHVTVGVFCCPGKRLDPLYPHLERVVPPFLPLELAVEGAVCFPAPYHSINLGIRRTVALAQLSEAARQAAASAGFAAQPFADWDYHISLLNSHYARRELTEEEYREACRLMEEREIRPQSAAHRVELWDPAFPPLTVLARFAGAYPESGP